MRKAFYGIVGASALAMASAASATITLNSNTPGVDPYAGPAPTYNFDSGSQPVNSGGAFVAGTLGISHAQPFGTAAGTGAYGLNGGYFAVGPADGAPMDATAHGSLDLSSLGPIGSISFIWGSVDSYNTLDFCADLACLTPLATFVGNDVFNPANGDRTDPNTNPLVTFLLTGSDQTDFKWLRLSSSQNAFEIDNLNVISVPEPATWALMLIGFAGIGMTLRRRRQTALAQIA